MLVSEKIYSETEIFGLVESATREAVKIGSPLGCAELPEAATFEMLAPPGRSYGKASTWPRSDCYWAYMQKTNDPAACSAINELSSKRHTAADCFKSIAIALKDVSFCEEAGPAQAECLAVVTNDVSPCFDRAKDEHDTSEYSRSVQWCIGEVARKAKDIQPCLIIDGPDFGDQWRIGRNQCLEFVAATIGLKAEELQEVCEQMVEDELGWDIKLQCLEGRTTVLGPGYK
jgi:hypothetical protein